VPENLAIGTPPAPTARVYTTEIPIELIYPPDALARPVDAGEYMADLKDSLRALGQISPVTVRAREGRFQVIDGMHRLTAAKEMGWRFLRCEVWEGEGLSVEAIQLHTCMVHKEMTAWEEYQFYYNLCERLGLSFEQACEHTHKSQSYVSLRLNIGNLTDESKSALRNNRISLGIAQQLMRIDDPLWERYWLDQSLINGFGTVVMKGLVNKWKLERQPLTSESLAAITAPAPPPPEPVEIPCALCGQPSRGRMMMVVTVHVDELNALATQIRILDAAKEAAPVPRAGGGE
jgi:ParB family chromosome partitioning protein